MLWVHIDFHVIGIETNKADRNTHFFCFMLLVILGFKIRDALSNLSISFRWFIHQLHLPFTLLLLCPSIYRSLLVTHTLLLSSPLFSSLSNLHFPFLHFTYLLFSFLLYTSLLSYQYFIPPHLLHESVCMTYGTNDGNSTPPLLLNFTALSSFLITLSFSFYHYRYYYLIPVLSPRLLRQRQQPRH